jgi:hypothetical protein
MYQDFSWYEKTIRFNKVLWRLEMAVSRQNVLPFRRNWAPLPPPPKASVSSPKT